MNIKKSKHHADSKIQFPSSPDSNSLRLQIVTKIKFTNLSHQNFKYVVVSHLYSPPITDTDRKLGTEPECCKETRDTVLKWPTAKRTANMVDRSRKMLLKHRLSLKLIYTALGDESYCFSNLQSFFCTKVITTFPNKLCARLFVCTYTTCLSECLEKLFSYHGGWVHECL